MNRYNVRKADATAGAFVSVVLLCAAVGFALGSSSLSATARGAEKPSAAVSSPSVPSPEAVHFFEAKIRPLLHTHCIECHGAKKQESGLRLDSRAAVLHGNDEGPVVLLNEPAKSPLLRAVRYLGDIQMPPAGKLSETEISAIEEWIKLDLPWPPEEQKGPAAGVRTNIVDRARSHWAFQPIQMPQLPAVTHTAWPQSAVDRFVLARLEAAGLTPSPAADRRTLIRRAYYDLIGLPPTTGEIAQFQLDNTPDAFAKVVDRLLTSPHYGERWGRYWLDLARYSDTKGYIFNEDRNFPHAYNYRDWVVQALNDDLPYDQFLLKQIAADCMSPGKAHDPSLAAMGFLTLGRRFLGIKPDIIDDRIDVVFRTTVGLTVSCARCHDHKFDPIPTADYYSLYGVFDASVEKQVPIETMTPEFEKGLREHERLVRETLAAGHAQVARELRQKVAGYLQAALEANQRGAPRTDDYDFVPFAGEMNPFFINRWRTYLDDTARRFDPVMAAFHAFAALPADRFATDSKDVMRQLAAPENEARPPINPLVAGLFERNPPASMAEVAERYAELLNLVSAEWESRVAAAEQQGSALPTKLDDENREQLRLVFYGPFAPTNVPTQDVELLLDQKTKDKVAELKRKLAGYAAGPGSPRQAMVLEEIEPIHNPRIFLRGNASRPGSEVPRQFLALLSPDRRPFQNRSGRLEMAEHIVAPDNPLTARVFVNRIWSGHFAAPLVRTPSDFGLRSEPPSHPELLDYLARSFVDNGWSIKWLHRTIMLSSVYQQSSGMRADCAVADPENRLLWRMNRRRLDWEATRDSLLASSGDLDRTIGGPAVEITARPYPRRRTIYARIERQNLPGLFRSFDFATPDAHAPERFTTTVPQQALFLLNGPFVADCAERVLAREELRSTREPQSRINAIYALLFGRSATATEASLGLEFIAQPPTAPPPLSANERLAATWQYGYGTYDEMSHRVTAFTELPHFNGSAWQGGPALPDEKLGWAMVTADGGHAGNDQSHATIRRWIAPAGGTVQIEGALKLVEAQGDGVRGRIVASRGGLAGEWLAEPKKKPEKTTAERIEVQAGDTIDFVVDLRTSIESDSFSWPVMIEFTQKASQSADSHVAAKNSNSPNPPPTVWDSVATFRKPRPTPLDVWSRYVQVLLSSNEFVFVD